MVDEALVAGTIANTNGLLVILAKLVAKGVFDRADLQAFSDSYSKPLDHVGMRENELVTQMQDQMESTLAELMRYLSERDREDEPRPRLTSAPISPHMAALAAQRWPLRLAVQDVALSRRKHGFESRRGHQRFLDDRRDPLSGMAVSVRKARLPHLGERGRVRQEPSAPH